MKSGVIPNTRLATRKTPTRKKTARKSAAPASKNLSETKSGQGADMGADIRGCVADDKSPAGTIVDGRKKMVNATPFGTVCRWEPVATK